MTISSSDYALLSQDSYHGHKLKDKVILGGIHYEVLDQTSDPRTGYQATAYKRLDTGEVVIAHRGTEFDREPVHDGGVDAGMVLIGVNAQTSDAMAFTQKVLVEAKVDSERSGRPLHVTVTGHSLGGTLAEITAYEYSLHGETFNAYGAASLLQGIPHGGHQVIDHVRAGDVVSAASPHFGEVRIYAAQQDIDTLSKAGYLDDGSLLSLRNPVKAVDFSAHAIDNFVPDSKTLGTSIINPENEARYRAHHGMIDRYRADVMDLRIGLSARWELPKLVAESGMVFGRSVAHEITQDVHAVEQGAKHAAHAVEHGVRHAAQAVEHTARNVAHTVGESVSQGVHATHHAVSQGIHAAEHAAHSLASDASKAFDALRHPGSWFDDKPVPAAAPVRLDHTTHPDHLLYQQTRNAVHRLDAEHHRTPDQHSDNLAAALVVAARRDGLNQVHHVALSDDASLTFAMQDKPQSPLRLTTQVHTTQAANTPIEQSSLAWQQDALSKQAGQAQAQQLVSPQHEQQVQHTSRPMGL
ncbi:MAG: XVIPCD domain-containing protein [Rhodanobacter sp.]